MFNLLVYDWLFLGYLPGIAIFSLGFLNIRRGKRAKGYPACTASATPLALPVIRIDLDECRVPASLLTDLVMDIVLTDSHLGQGVIARQIVFMDDHLIGAM